MLKGDTHIKSITREDEDDIEFYCIKFKNGWEKLIWIYHTDVRAMHVEIYNEYGWMQHYNEYELK